MQCAGIGPVGRVDEDIAAPRRQHRALVVKAGAGDDERLAGRGVAASDCAFVDEVVAAIAQHTIAPRVLEADARIEGEGAGRPATTQIGGVATGGVGIEYDVAGAGEGLGA